MAANMDAAASDVEVLYDRLDGLWTQYLALLDNYHIAHAQLQKSLAAGYISLSQANFRSTTGRRFGQDYYDARASATTRVKLARQNSETQLGAEICALDYSVSKSAQSADPDKQDSDGKDGRQLGTDQLPTPEATPQPDPEHQEKSRDDRSRQDTEADPDAVQRPLRDPIRQFGILVPPALRAAQKSFTAAIQSPECVSQAVTAARSMREIETEIRKLRKVIKKAEREVDV